MTPQEENILLREALDYIHKRASRSRTQSYRIQLITRTAQDALNGIPISKEKKTLTRANPKNSEYKLFKRVEHLEDTLEKVLTLMYDKLDFSDVEILQPFHDVLEMTLSDYPKESND